MRSNIKTRHTENVAVLFDLPCNLTRLAVHVKCNTEARSCNLCCLGKAVSITVFKCVPVSLSYLAALDCHLWPLWLYNIFRYLTDARFSEKTGIKNKMCVVIFFIQLLFSIFIFAILVCLRYKRSI
jgi:hypothetical protein